MATAALTFRGDADLIEAIRAYADKLGVSVNTALRDMIAPIVGFAKKPHASSVPRNDLAKFCGALKNVDCRELERMQESFSTIDQDMWK